MVKVATKLTLSIIDLTRALVAKKTPGYANADKWGIYSYEDVIYPQARLAFPTYNKLYDSNAEFTNYFVRDLNKKDSQLVKIIGEKNVEKILIGVSETEGEVYGEAVPEQTAGAAALDQGVSGESPSTMAGGIPFGGGISGTAPARRIIRIIPHAQEAAKSDLVVANKSGVVREAGDPSKLVKTTRSGAIIEPGQRSTLVTANSSGVVREAPPSKIFIANKSGVVTGVRNIKSPSWLKTFGSNAQIFAKKNLGRIGSGLGEMLGGIGRGIGGPALNGLYNLSGKAGGGVLSTVGRLPGFSGPKPGGFSLSKGLGAGRQVALVSLAFILLFGFITFSAVSQSPTSTEASPQTPGFIGTLAPPPSPDYQILHDDILKQFGVDFDLQNPFPYDYLTYAWEKLWNVSNTKFLELVRGADKNKIITVKREDKGFNEQRGCLSIIMSGISSVDQKPYPKSLFQVVFIHELTHVIQSCNPNAVNFTALDAALKQEGGISTFSQDPTKCISGVTQLNEDFAETLAYYLNQEWGEQSYFSTCPPKDSTNPILRGDKPLHQQFVASLLGVTALIPQTIQSGNLPKFSCPVIGDGESWYGSFQADPKDGHCGSNYNQRLKTSDPNYVACSGDSRRGKSMDRKTGGANGDNIVLPMIDNKIVEWQLINQFDLSANDCFAEEIINPDGLNGGCGKGYVFQTPPVAKQVNGQNWILHLLHMGPTSFNLNQIYTSGETVGKTEAIHVHISLGQNISNSLSQTEPGWKSVDTELKLCQ